MQCWQPWRAPPVTLILSPAVGSRRDGRDLRVPRWRAACECPDPSTTGSAVLFFAPTQYPAPAAAQNVGTARRRRGKTFTAGRESRKSSNATRVFVVKFGIFSSGLVCHPFNSRQCCMFTCLPRWFVPVLAHCMSQPKELQTG